MPEQPDPFDLTPEDVDQILNKGIEDMTGKPVNHGDLTANIAKLSERIAWYQRELKILDHTSANATNPASIAGLSRERRRLLAEKAEAEKLLADYELQRKQQN